MVVVTPLLAASLVTVSSLRCAELVVLLTTVSLKQFSTLTNLQTLNLNSTQISTEVLQLLFSTLTALSSLELGKTSVISVKGISALQKLTYLALNECPIDDEGLQYVTALTTLYNLNVVSRRRGQR